MGNCLGGDAKSGDKNEERTSASKPNVKRMSATKTDVKAEAVMNEIAKKSALVRVSASPSNKSGSKSAAPTDMLSAINDDWHAKNEEAKAAADDSDNGVVTDAPAPLFDAPATAAAAPAAATSTSTA